MFIDSHAHIYVSEFEVDVDSVIANALGEQVEEVYMPNIDLNSMADMLNISDRYDHCKPMIGLHPCYVKGDYKQELKDIMKYLDDYEFAGVGECGIDLYWDRTYVEEQKKAFDYQINLARDLELPVIIHSRDSLELTISAIAKYQDGNLSGIFHCFNGTLDQGMEIIDLGFYMGIGGVITFKNAGVDKTVAELPLESMVLETDAPYLTPTPYRGKRNLPSYIPIIAEKLAQIKSVDTSEVARITSSNCRMIFKY